jgi:hypothetical protein
MAFIILSAFIASPPFWCYYSTVWGEVQDIEKIFVKPLF